MWSNYIDHTEHVASRCDFFACIHISDLSMCEKYNSNNLVCKNVNGECKQATCSDISSDHCNLYVSITN